MGCTTSRETEQNNYPLETQKLPENITNNSYKIDKPKKSKVINQPKLKNMNKSKQKQIKQASQSQKNIYASNKSLKKQQSKNKREQNLKIRQSGHNRMSLSPSKIKFKIDQMKAVNEQEINQGTSLQKKKRKIKRKKTDLDPRLGELVKIYAL